MIAAETAFSTVKDHFERACRFLEARQVESAFDLFTEAERLGYDPDECGGGRWFCRMLAGEFEQAWQESDLISQRGTPDSNRLWSGEPLAGKRVVIRCLHGLGDAIQFIRFAPLLRKRAAAISVEVPNCLVRLFQTIPGIDLVFTWEAPPAVPPEWDDHIEVMELPWFFRTTVASLPAAVPYLFPEPAERKISEFQKPAVKVGLAWAASNWNPSRSIPLPMLLPILSIPQHSFYSLQVGSRSEDIASVRSELAPPQLITAEDDVLSTASLMLQLDLVITVDTMIAHLAGALGKPVWLLLTCNADWRWMLGREDSPWYPTMRIFRQQANGEWASVVKEVVSALQKEQAANKVQFTFLEKAPSLG